MTTVASAGADLHTEVFLPDGDGPWPALLHRTPYGTPDQRAAAEHLAGRGFAAVLQDVRGRFGSTGEFDFGDHDALDGARSVEWCAEQPWSDGRVGMHGLSYPGWTQWQAAIDAPPALACISPSMCPGWWASLEFREGGAVLLALAAHWLPRQAASHAGVAPEAAVQMFERAFEVEHVAPGGGPRLSADAVLTHPALTADRLAEPFGVAGSPAFETIWRRLWAAPTGDIQPGPAQPQAPALVATGWWDPWMPTAVDAFTRLDGDDHRLVLAPAGHGFDPPREHDPGPEAQRFGGDVGERWAEELLLGVDHGMRSLAPVTYFELDPTGPGRWRSARAWPPPGTRRGVLTLSGSTTQVGRLLPSAPPAARVARHIVDPMRPVVSRGGRGMLLPPGPARRDDLSAEHRFDTSTFDSEPLANPVTLAGRPVVRLFVELDVPDADLVVTLSDVAPGGEVWSITDGIQRLRWRHGTSTPSFVTPGEVVQVEVALGDVAWLLRAGHRLRLDVTGTCFPRIDRNTHTTDAEGTTPPERWRSARVTLHTGPGIPAQISYPYLERT